MNAPWNQHVKRYTVITYGCAEWLCRTGRIPGELEYRELTRRLTVQEIKEAVAARFQIPLREMTSARRHCDVARPRQVSMYLCKQLTDRSFPEIGRYHGDRDHTTVIHAVRRIEKLRAERPELDYAIRDLTEALERPHAKPIPQSPQAFCSPLSCRLGRAGSIES